MNYVLKQDSSGQFRFNLKAANGQVILSSEGYGHKSSAMNGIESVRANGHTDGNYERKMSTAHEPYFVLKAGNGQTLGTSEMYASEAARDNGIASVQANCGSNEIEDLT